MLRPLALLVLALCLVLLPPGSAAAGPLVEAGAPTGETSQAGLWSTGDGTLAPDGRSTEPRHLLLGRALRDGVFHATIATAADKKMALGLWLRASERAGTAEGIVLNFYRSRVRLERVAEGAVVAITPWETVKRLKRLDRLEVWGFVVGTTALVQIHDARGRLLDTLVVEDDGLERGRLGLRAEPKRSPGGALVDLRALGWCGELTEDVAAPERFVGLGTADLDAVRAMDPPLESLEEIERDDDAERVLVKTTTGGLARLVCAGITPQTVAATVPLRFVDPEYRAWREKGLEATETGFALPPGTKDPVMVEAILRAYADRFPERTRLVEIGRSHGERPLLALAISNQIAFASGRPAVLLNGAHHGNEPLSVDFVIDAVQWLLEHPDDPTVSAWLDQTVVWAVPLVNPDGLDNHLNVSARAGRKNGRQHADPDDQLAPRHHGIDLNRNYPFRWGEVPKGSSRNLANAWYRGEEAASEPETQAMMALADAEHFAASISYHTGNVIILAPYTIDETVQPEPNEAWSVAEYVAQEMPHHPPTDRVYEVAMQIYSVDGTDQDWHRHAHGTVALLVEGSNISYLDPEVRKATIDAVRTSWTRLLERTVAGPTLVGRVVDPDGEPLVAEITLSTQTLAAGERWTSRCRDGGFARYLTVPGEVTVTARIGDASASETVAVTEDGISTVELVLEPAANALRPECRAVLEWTALPPLAAAGRVGEGLARLAGKRVASALVAAQPGAVQHPGSPNPNNDTPRESASAPAVSDEAAERARGCGCRSLTAVGEPSGTGSTALLVLLALGLVRRRR